jgi:chemotaxis protein MotB
LARRRRRLTDGENGGEQDGGGSLRWLLTYADMITLLMAFFIMLYSMSVLNLNRFKQVAVSIRSGFGGIADGRGHTMWGMGGVPNTKPSSVDGEVAGIPWQTVEKIQRLIREKHLSRAVKLRVDDRGLIVSLVTDKVLFTKGQADLSGHAKQIIGELADTIRGIPNNVAVEGHTCNLPVRSDKFASNWELSTARATAVVRYLIEDAWMSPDRLSAAGYADSKPLQPNTNEANRAQNRRVDIVILRTEYGHER